MQAPFEGVCFSHALSKACQYVTSNEKVNSSLQLVSVKIAQSSIQSCRTYPKKFGKRKVEWTKACLVIGLQPQNLNTPMKTRFVSKVAMFQQAFEFKEPYYSCLLQATNVGFVRQNSNNINFDNC